MRTQPNIIGVHLVFEQVGQVLLQQRSPSAEFAPNEWHLPAGHLEAESAVECAVRESGEELGVEIDPQDLRLVHVLHYRDGIDSTPRMQLFFRVLAHRGTPRICEPDRCTALAWHPYAALPAPLVDYTAVALTAIAANRPYTAMGWGA
ncbi:MULTISPECIES: NUDIX domain-containing protein [unclassified Streptomyces]|uniref:NUDIX hydrolase n=1 Tax=unclassified Streptomyces TaxID=2593676 RepID=UPI00380A37D0